MNMNKIVNPIVKWILRSPLHGLFSASLLLITYRGCKSGREYSLPVQYAQDDQHIFILPGQPETKTWWRNFKSGAPVTLVLRGKTRHGQARLLETQNEVQATIDGLAAYLRRFPGLAKSHHVQIEADGSFNSADLHKAAAVAHIICVVFSEGNAP
jgi:Cft2 family RNA processing exonuclease